jgi:prevent-host-death family protein
VKIASVADVKARFSSYLERSRQGPVVITKNGRPVAVLIAAMEDEEELERLILAYTPRFRKLIEDARQRILAGGGIAHEDFWRSLEKDAEPSR